MWVVPLLAVLAAGSGHAPDMAVARPGVVAAAVTPQSAAVDVPPIGASLRRLAAVIGTSDEPTPARFAAWPARLREAQQRGARALTTLIGLSSTWPAETPEPYRRQLAATATLVERAAQEDSGTSLAALVEPLADDLETKLAHCQASGGRLGGLVTVRVRTVHAAREAANWQVLTLPRLFAASPGATPTPFPQLSSPTVERLVPGRYLLWARDPVSGGLSERQVLVVGDGRAAVDIDLPVPTQGG